MKYTYRCDCGVKDHINFDMRCAIGSWGLDSEIGRFLPLTMLLIDDRGQLDDPHGFQFQLEPFFNWKWLFEQGQNFVGNVVDGDDTVYCGDCGEEIKVIRERKSAREKAKEIGANTAKLEKATQLQFDLLTKKG